MFTLTQKRAYTETLRALLEVSSPSGREHPMREYLMPICQRLCADVFEDPFGNLVCHFQGSGPRLMITAHIDELGFIIKSISPEGFLHFQPLGGHLLKQLEARQVMVNGTIPGIIGAKSGHLMSAEEMATITPANQMFIDIGVTSAKEARDLGITVGSYANIRNNYMELTNPDYICCRTLDDRAGAAVLLELMRGLETQALAFDLYLVFTLQEEVGLRGAQAAAHNLCPDVAIALDTMPCGDYPGNNWQRDLPVQLGHGVCCNITEGKGPMSFMHPRLQGFLLGTAEENQIDVQVVSVCGLSCSTDSNAMAVAGKGCHAGALTIPRRYSHSPVELMHLHDALSMLALVSKLVYRAY